MDIKFLTEVSDDVHIERVGNDIKIWQCGEVVVVPAAEAIAFAEALKAWATQQETN